ncbi:autotransporter outer membrane beta-barrel domain-containing protein [Chryseobacterium aquaticum]|uniref:Peptidase S74 domain-containing protein n=1 Tax=Chryseobacterium aquaticum subsp. greenlandense TaxID=345663 RepID=A0A117KCQ7_9FLAO|nr:hypothetical protein [Chryseobacterium aquaticum]KUJ57793.1 hypothetical protein AR686_03290 [Chryseobacterium aquaticum subsp. greenlandense]
MKSKQELKKYFENGDKPTQEQFWEWQDSYWHKDEKLPADKIDYDFSEKADLIDGKVPASQLPSYVDDVLEFADLAGFPAAGESGKLYVALNTNKLYRWSGSAYVDITQSETDTLQSVIARGNQIATGGYISYSTSSTSRSLALGANSTTFSLFFGNMNPAHTGTFNIAMGFNSGANLSTGLSNILLGAYTGTNLTTGNSNTLVGVQAGRNQNTSNGNTLVGSEAGFSSTIGYKNTFIGAGSAYQNTTGNLNTIIGYKSGLGSNLGDRNTIIGMGAGQGVSGTNNVLIGVGAGVNGGALTNKLIIHSNHTLSGYSNTAEGTMTTPQLSYLSNALITGDFVEKWVKINGSFSTQTANYNVNFDGTTGDLLFISGNSSPSRFTITPSKIGLSQGTGIISKSIILDNALDYITIGSSSTGAGMVGSSYFGGNYVDNSFVQKKYVDGTVGNFIPLTGTEVDKPVSGELKIEAPITLGTDTYSLINTVNGSIDDDEGAMNFNHNDEVNVNVQEHNFKFDEKGLSSLSDFSLTKNVLAFVQKKYVDKAVENFIPLDGTDQFIGSISNPNGNFIVGFNSVSNYNQILLDDQNVEDFPNKHFFLYGNIEEGFSTGYMKTDTSYQTSRLSSLNYGIEIISGYNDNVTEPKKFIFSEGRFYSETYNEPTTENDYVQKKYVDQKSSYSSNEEITGGQWIDGKPIYKKTVKFDTIPSTGEIDLTSHFQDVETVVSNQMFTEWYNMDVAFAGNQYRGKAFITVQPEMAKIEYVPNIDYDYSMINSFTLTLEYTKRTI